MSSLPPKYYGKNTVDFDIGNSKQSSEFPCSHAFASGQKSPVKPGGDLICETDRVPGRYILARAVPFYTQNMQDFSYRPLQHDIWCLVKTEEGKFEYDLLSKCQKQIKAGEFRYHDIDWGKGLHPSEDIAWLWMLKAEGQWSRNVYDVEALVILEEKNHVTVLLSAKGHGSKLLKEIRQKCHYASDEFIRLPLSIFTRSERRTMLAANNVSQQRVGSRMVYHVVKRSHNTADLESSRDSTSCAV